MKSEAERNIERMTLGAMLILVGIALLIHLPNGAFSLTAAIILLGSAYYQRSQGWHASSWIWFFGGLFALSGLMNILGALLGFVFTWWPLILIGLGVMMLLDLDKKR